MKLECGAEPDWSLTARERDALERKSSDPEAYSGPKIRTARQAWLDEIANPSPAWWRGQMKWQRTFAQDPQQYDAEALRERLEELEPLITACRESLAEILEREQRLETPLGPEWEKVNFRRLRLKAQQYALREALEWWEQFPDLIRTRFGSNGSAPLPLSVAADPFEFE